MDDRIEFPGSPWRRGHRIAKLEWTARLVPDVGVFFDLHLESADYFEEPPDRVGAESWENPRVWGNYHSCVLSSTYWDDHAGILVGTEEHKLDLPALREIRADPLPRMDDDAALGIYLLGHDAVADHHLRFTRLHGGAFALEWTAKVARAYIGDRTYRQEMRAHAAHVAFGGIFVDGDVRRAPEHLARYVVDAPRFTLTGHGGRARFVSPVG
jgi:hypothetical protein